MFPAAQRPAHLEMGQRPVNRHTQEYGQQRDAVHRRKQLRGRSPFHAIPVTAVPQHIAEHQHGEGAPKQVHENIPEFRTRGDLQQAFLRLLPVLRRFCRPFPVPAVKNRKIHKPALKFPPQILELLPELRKFRRAENCFVQLCFIGPNAEVAFPA